ncbi:hypothetical protein ACFL26_00915 [Patescibacteria group bacterium]
MFEVAVRKMTEFAETVDEWLELRQVFRPGDSRVDEALGQAALCESDFANWLEILEHRTRYTRGLDDRDEPLDNLVENHLLNLAISPANFRTLWDKFDRNSPRRAEVLDRLTELLDPDAVSKDTTDTFDVAFDE